MAPSQTVASPTAVADAVAASDELYFSLGARCLTVGPVALHVCEGHVDVPAATVAVGLWPGRGAAAAAWVGTLLGAADSRGARQVRTYLARGEPEARRAAAGLLAAAGATVSTEVLLAASTDSIDPCPTPLRLDPIVDEAGWGANRRVHAADGRGPDGHDSDPRRWVAFERAKARHAPFLPHLARWGDDVVAAVALMDTGAIVRLKNLVVAPGWRGRGVAGEVVRAAAAMHPGRTLGCMAVVGSTAQGCYLRAGLTEVGRVDEWTLPVP